MVKYFGIKFNGKLYVRTIKGNLIELRLLAQQ